MNEKTKELIEFFERELKSFKSGELSLPSRKILWHSLTEDKPNDEKTKILTSLDCLCINYGADKWMNKFGDTTQLNDILAVALDAADGVISEEKAMAVRDEFYVAVVEDEVYEADEYPAMFIGHAAANTVATAVSDFEFNPADLRNDLDHDPEAFEPSFLVASAIAGGLGDEGDPHLRRKFWEWYLSVAVRQAAQ